MSSFADVFKNLALQTGFATLTWKHYVMILIACVFMYLAIVKGFEPLLLVPISFGMFLVNMFPDIIADGGLLHYFYLLDEWSILAIPHLHGCWCHDRLRSADCKPEELPAWCSRSVWYLLLHTSLHSLWDSTERKQQQSLSSVVQMALHLSSLAGKLGTDRTLMGPIAVAAYSYMSLVPIIQPPYHEASYNREGDVRSRWLSFVRYPSWRRSYSQSSLLLLLCLILPYNSSIGWYADA